jgi:hypothetical protein
MADPTKPIPHRFTTPEELQSSRLSMLGGDTARAQQRLNLPFYADALPSIALSFGSSFMDGLAGDAKTLNYVFNDDITKGTGESLRDIAEQINAYKPQRIVDAQQKQFITDDYELGEAWGDLYAHLDLFGSGMGSIAAMLVGGGLMKLAAKGGIKAMVKQSINKKADDMVREGAGEITYEEAQRQVKKKAVDIAEKYDTIIGAGAYGTAEMAIVSGSVGHSIEEEVMRAPAEVLNTSPRFKEIYYDLIDNNDLTHDQAHNLARTKLSREAGIQGAKDVAIPTLILGTIAGNFVNKALQGRLTKSTLANFAILESAEIPTETAQGAYEQYTQNKVYKELVDKTRNVMAGVPDAALREGLGVAFGVAPLSAITAKAQASQARGEDMSVEDLTDEEELILIDAAAKVDEAATEAAIALTDPKEKWVALRDIIKSQVEGINTGEEVEPAAAIEEKGPFPNKSQADINFINQGSPANLQVYERPDGQWMIGGKSQAQVAERVATERGLKAETLEEEIPVEEIDVGEPAPTAEGIEVEELTTEEVGDPLPQIGVTEEALEDVVPDEEITMEGGTVEPLPEAVNDAVRIALAISTPNQAVEGDVSGVGEDLKNLSRKELNAIARAVGVKSGSSRGTLTQGIRSMSVLANTDADAADDSVVDALNKSATAYLRQPSTAKDARQQLKSNQNLLRKNAIKFAEKESGRRDLEQSIERGELTQEEFLALPKAEQRAMGDIGLDLKSGILGDTTDAFVPEEAVPEIEAAPTVEAAAENIAAAVDKPAEPAATEEAAPEPMVDEGVSLTDNERNVIADLRSGVESEDDGWGTVYLDNVIDTTDKSVRSTLGSLKKKGMYQVEDGYAFGRIKLPAAQEEVAPDEEVVEETALDMPVVEEEEPAGPVTMKGNRLYLGDNITSKSDLLYEIDRVYSEPNEYIAKDPTLYTAELVMEMYNDRAGRGVEEVPEYRAAIGGNTYEGLPKGMQQIADDPRVQRIDDERKEDGIFGRQGNGYWVYLLDPWYNPEMESGTIHEGNIKDIQRQMKGIVFRDESDPSFNISHVEDQIVQLVDTEITLEKLPQELLDNVTLVDYVEDLPEAAQKKIEERNLYGQVKGVYHGGDVYIVTRNHVSVRDAIFTVMHEVIGHRGLRALMGDELVPLLRQVASHFPAEVTEIADRYKIDLRSANGVLEAAEEVLAHMAEVEANSQQTVVQKLIAMFRNFLRKIGIDLDLSENDIRNILTNAKKAVALNSIDIETSMPEDIMFNIKPSTVSNHAATTTNASAIKAFKEGQPIDSVFRGLWGLAELTQLPKAVRVTSAAALRGTMNFYDKRMPWAHPTMEYLGRALIDQYGLDAEYKKTRASQASMEANLIDEVRDIIDLLEAEAGSSNYTKITEILTKEAPQEAAWDAVTEPIRRRIEELGQDAVELGLISQESYEANKGAYLHRVYMKYEENRSTFSKWADNLSGRRKKIVGDETMERGLSQYIKVPRLVQDLGIKAADLIVDGKGITVYRKDKLSDNGQKILPGGTKFYKTKPDAEEGYKVQKFKVRAKTGMRVKLWRDWTKQEREDMGEITDARYVLGKTFALLAHDISTGTFFKTISENPAWTWQEEGTPPDAIDGETALLMKVVTGGAWVKVPETKIKKSPAKKYGALAGKYVRAEIFQDINQTVALQKNTIWKDILLSFKKNKTARNPVVHFNNVMSNIVLMDMADVRFSDLYHALREITNKGDLYREAKAHGALGVSFAQMELKNDTMKRLLDEIHDVVGAPQPGVSDVVLAMEGLPLRKQIAFMTKIADTLWHGVDIRGRKVGLKQFDEKMLNYYQHEDEVFRLATYIRRRNEGMDPNEAGIQARDQFLNYDINAPWINALRASVMPFLSYTYRAVPIVAKSIMSRPWKLAKYFTLAYGANAVAYALTGGDEEEERKSMREDKSGMLWIGANRMIRMPWMSEDDNPYFWDIRRMIPVGDVFDLNQHHAALPIIPASLMPTGPIAMGFEFVMNKTSFFGEEIVDPLADDWATKTEKTMDWMWKSFGPSAPWVPWSYYWDKLGIAATGGRDRLGREYSIPEALSSSFGLKIARHDVTYGIALKGMEIERRVEAIRFQLSQHEKDYWQGKMSKGRYERVKARYMRSLSRLEDEARELLR